MLVSAVVVVVVVVLLPGSPVELVSPLVLVLVESPVVGSAVVGDSAVVAALTVVLALMESMPVASSLSPSLQAAERTAARRRGREQAIPASHDQTPGPGKPEACQLTA